ncbi:MAG TPA: hypothetical protein GX708_09675 [Gallicola sp.]|nr:hypothetical protein [Gallicola sp.]
MIIIYIVLAISITINILFIIYDVLPYIIPVIVRKNLKSKNIVRDVYTLENLITSASLSLIKNKSSMMSWHTGGLYMVIFKKIFTKSSTKEFKNYNYPRGFLLYGLSEYLIKTDNNTELLNLKNIFDKYYITVQGDFNFNFNKVDQATFGLIAINLYKTFKDVKYKVFIDNIYSFIHQKYKKDNLVLYREKTECEFNDTIGMIVPFLVKYYQLSSDVDALEIASNQMSFFIKYGVDDKTFLPSHGINIKAKIKTGSSNWGRGIGWYLIGLKELFELNGSFKNEYEGICATLQKVKNDDGLWGQFPGSKNNFDASTTTMFIYSLPQNEFSHDEVLSKLNKYITKKGYINLTSGDTEGLNYYSKFFGTSELSQGFLHLILSRYENRNHYAPVKK